MATTIVAGALSSCTDSTDKKADTPFIGKHEISIEGDRMTLNVELADIRAEFEDTVFMYGSRLRQEGIDLNYIDTDIDVPMIPCDTKRLRQVFLNILDNAAKHGGEGKTIDASIHKTDTAVVIDIRDYGPGIPEDEIPLVKKKFYKGSSKARGTGIGLAISDEIVQMHGGELTLENALAGGVELAGKAELLLLCLPQLRELMEMASGLLSSL